MFTALATATTRRALVGADLNLADEGDDQASLHVEGIRAVGYKWAAETRSGTVPLSNSIREVAPHPAQVPVTLSGGSAVDHAFTEWGLPGNALPTAVASRRLTARPAKTGDAGLWWAATEDETLDGRLARRVADAGHRTHDAALDELLGLGDWR